MPLQAISGQRHNRKICRYINIYPSVRLPESSYTNTGAYTRAHTVHLTDCTRITSIYAPLLFLTHTHLHLSSMLGVFKWIELCWELIIYVTGVIHKKEKNYQTTPPTMFFSLIEPNLIMLLVVIISR